MSVRPVAQRDEGEAEAGWIEGAAILFSVIIVVLVTALWLEQGEAVPGAAEPRREGAEVLRYPEWAHRPAPCG